MHLFIDLSWLPSDANTKSSIATTANLEKLVSTKQQSSFLYVSLCL